MSPSKRGWKLSKETRKKMSLAAKRSWENPIRRARAREYQSNRPLEHLENIRRGLLGKKRLPEAIENSRRGLQALSLEKKEERSAKMRAAWAKRKEHPVSEQTRKKHSISTRKHNKLDLPDCRCVIHTNYINSSKLSDRMIENFLKEFPEVIPEKQFGRYRVDVYLPPPYHLAFEADGDYWHSLPDKQKHDIQRDAYLLKEFNLPVIRLTETEINEGLAQY